jgi:translation initiation factor eIF-2B subunit alpha/methylthioribose-1-phosphate isomerase
MLVNGKAYRTVWFEKDRVRMINQLLLPHKFGIVDLKGVKDVADAIRNMVIRGAPAIGAAGAYGVALAALKGEDVQKAADMLRSTRPTANDLFYGIDYVLDALKGAEAKQSKAIAIKAAEDYANWSARACEDIGHYGASLMGEETNVLTHCNAGWLACVDWGTALAPVYAASRDGKKIFVFVDETRPRLQGAKLTSWELMNEKIPHAVIADNAAGHYMYRKEVSMVIVGADRIASNGDVVNKIGTYEKAVVAKDNAIPFYVAAPSSTVDLSKETGDSVPIEERDESEVLFVGKERVAAPGAKAKNPAFDVTPARLVKGIITENGIVSPLDIRDVFAKE